MNIDGLQDTNLINGRAAIFKNLLITKFRLVEKIGSKVVFSKETCAELVEVKGLIDELMTNSPDAKVKYSLKRVKNRTVKPKSVRGWLKDQNRTMNLFTVFTYPILLWVRWLLHSNLFHRFFYLVALWNMASVALDIEYGQTGLMAGTETFTVPVTSKAIKVNLAIAQITLTIILLLELAMKWTLDFQGYWRRFWNYVDFFVVVTTTPFIGTFFEWYELDFVGEITLHACRSLIALKLIHELDALKAVLELLALTVASMVYVVSFIVMLTFLCGLIGTTLFDVHVIPPSQAGLNLNEVKDWEAAYVFSHGLGRSLLIIFKLFTLDGWYKFYKDFALIHDIYASSIFIFTWVFLSAFLLGNLFPALLITNFQRIRSELKEEMEHSEIVREMSQEILQLGDQMQNNRIPLATNVSNESTVTDKIGVDVVLKATSYSETSIHTVDISEAFLDKLYAHPTLPGEMHSDAYGLKSSKSEIYATTPIVAVQSATPPTQSPKSSLASDSGATPTQEFFSKATSAATKGTFTPTKHTPSGSLTTPPLPSRASFASTAKETLLLSQLDLASLMKLMPSVLEPGRPMTTVHESRAVEGARTSKTEHEKVAKHRGSKPLSAKGSLKGSSAVNMAQIPNVASDSSSTVPADHINDREKVHVQTILTLATHTNAVLKEFAGLHVLPRRNLTVNASKQERKMSFPSRTAYSLKIPSKMSRKSSQLRKDFRELFALSQGASVAVSGSTGSGGSKYGAHPSVTRRSTRITNDGLPFISESDTPSLIYESTSNRLGSLVTQNNTERGAEEYYDVASSTILDIPFQSAKNSLGSESPDTNNNAAEESGELGDPGDPGEVGEEEQLGRNNNAKKHSDDKSQGVQEGSSSPSTTTQSSLLKSAKPNSPQQRLSDQKLLPDSQPAKEAQLLYTNSFLTGPNSPNQSELSDTTIIPISGLAVSKTWGSERRAENSSPFASKLASVLQMFKMLSPAATKGKTKPRASLEAEKDVEINLISATPRTSHRVNSTSANYEKSLPRSAFDESQQLFVQRGAKSKLSMIESSMGKEGKSFKIMRTLGRKAQAMPSEFNVGRKPLVSSRTSLNSLRKAFLHRKHYSDHILQRQWLMQEIRRVLLEHEQRASKWNETVNNCHLAIHTLEVETEWTDIVLLNYLYTLTELMENMMEREHLLSLVSQCLLSFNDDIYVDKSDKTFNGRPAWSLLHLVKAKVARHDSTRRASNYVEKEMSIDMGSSSSRTTESGSIGAMAPVGAQKDDSFEKMLFGPRRSSMGAFSPDP